MSTSKGENPKEKEVCNMPEEFKPGCQRPPIKKPVLETVQTSEVNVKEAKKPMVKVGKPAPEFTASAYHNGKFMNIGLSEFKGKWVLLCFYPGDFTFV
jgi:peroxiredoxin (alkyl hydroperoxide reductase subunit C)